jgi:ABC-type Fe3+ transport system substrate-binding protein
VGLLFLVVGVPFLLRPQGAGGAAEPAVFGDDADALIIITPHNEQIRFEMAAGFNRWRAEQNLPAVRFDWRASGGTTDLRNGILAQFEARARQDRVDDGIGADLFFGGGDYDHGKVARGVTLGLGDDTQSFLIVEAPRLPDGLFEAAFPQPNIGGEPLYHPDRLWIGTALSSFGIVYNRDLLDMLGGVSAPTTWADLADPRYVNWLAMADPNHSGSITTALNTVLARTGWTEGWADLRRIYANARYFAASSTKIPLDVSSGEAAAGMAIDFYGRYQAGAIAAAQGDGPGRVGYIDPVIGGVSMSATSSDPITLLRGAPHRETAEQFIAWVLSPEAQHLWQAEAGSPGGTVRYELRRMPIRRDVYRPEYRQHWVDPEINPFETARPLLPGMNGFRSAIGPLSHALAIDIHDDLKDAWRAIQRTPDDHPDKAEMLRLFDELPEALTLRWPSESIAADWREILDQPDHPQHAATRQTLEDFSDRIGDRSDDQKLKDKLEWTLFFREQYRKIAGMGAG